MLGDVGQPEPIGRLDVEAALHQVLFGGLVDQVAAALAPVDALHAGRAHEPFDALAVDLLAQPEGEFGMHPRRAVAAARVGVYLSDYFSEFFVAEFTRRLGPAEPVVISRCRHLEYSAGHRDRN